MLKVNLGCGTIALPDWDNLDISYSTWLSRYPIFKKILYKLGLIDEVSFRTDWPSCVKRYNVLKGLPYDDCTVDYIYTSHFLEHLTKEEATRVLKECYRVLKKCGIIRIVVPDLKLLAEKYVQNDHVFFNARKNEPVADKFLVTIGLGYERQSCLLTHLYDRFVGAARHRWMWDFDSLRHELVRRGFTSVEKKGFKCGKVPDIELLDSRPGESLYVEAMK